MRWRSCWALAKDLRNQDAFVRGGGWEKKVYRGHELRGPHPRALVGIGAIGRAFAAMVEPLGMKTIAYDPFAPDDAFGPHATRVDELDALLCTCRRRLAPLPADADDREADRPPAPSG